MTTLNGPVFLKTVVVGVVATFVMTMTGFWQAGIGLPAIDVGAMLARDMNSPHVAMLYNVTAGNVAHFGNGVVLALLFVALLQAYLPRSWIAQGVIYAIILEFAAALIVIPLVAGVGIFFSAAPQPGAMWLATFIVHLFYGLALGLGLKVAGVRQEVREGKPVFVQRLEPSEQQA